MFTSLPLRNYLRHSHDKAGPVPADDHTQGLPGTGEPRRSLIEPAKTFFGPRPELFSFYVIVLAEIRKITSV